MFEILSSCGTHVPCDGLTFFSYCFFVLSSQVFDEKLPAENLFPLQVPSIS